MYYVKAHACYLKVYILYEWLAVYLDFIINVEEYDIDVDLTLLREKWSQFVSLIQQLYLILFYMIS